MKDAIVKRLQQLRERMSRHHVPIQYVLIPTGDYHNSEYISDYFKAREFFSGFTGSNGTLLIAEDFAGLWTDGRYFIQAEKQLQGTGITLFKMGEKDVPTIAEYLKTHIKGGEVLALDGKCISARAGEVYERAVLHNGGIVLSDFDAAAGIWLDRPPISFHEVTYLEACYAGLTVTAKVETLRKVMHDKHADVLVLSKLDDIMWLCNIRGKDITCNPVAFSYAIITENDAALYMHMQSANQEIQNKLKAEGITLKEYEAFDQALCCIEQLCCMTQSKEESTCKREELQTSNVLQKQISLQKPIAVWIDQNNISFHILQVLKRQNCSLLLEDDPVEELKAVKNEAELKLIREAYLQDSVALTKFLFWLENCADIENLTEYDAAMKLDDFRRDLPGFWDVSFPTISAYGENGAIIHYEATYEQAVKLQRKGMLMLDSGGQYLGTTTDGRLYAGTTDVTRTIALGPVTQDMKKHFTLVLCGMLRLANAVFMEGCTGRNLDILARLPLWKHGLDFKHGTGHGIGYLLDCHEGPQAFRWKKSVLAKDAELKSGMIISDEPGVYLEGSHGIRIENILECISVEPGEDIALQRFGFRHLTLVPVDITLVDSSYMEQEDIALLNQYHDLVFRSVSAYLDKDECAWLRERTRAIS